jgi:uncharacterized paraquat-inducible protein A
MSGRIADVKRNVLSVLLFAAIVVVISATLMIGQQSNSFSIQYSIGLLKARGITYKYNLWDGLQRLRDDKLYVIYWFLLMWSGIFPYLKFGILLISVYAFKNPCRVNMLQWISFFGKWSFADIWTVVFICFSIHLDGRFQVLHTEAHAHIQAVALDGAGVFLLGVLFSQLFTIGLLLYYKSHMSLEPQFNVVPQSEDEEVEDNDGIEMGPSSAQDEDDEDEEEQAAREDTETPTSRDLLRRRLYSWRGRPCHCHWALRLIPDVAIAAVLVASMLSLLRLPLLHITYKSFNTVLATREFSLPEALRTLWLVPSSAAGGGLPDTTHLLCLAAIFMVVTFPVLQHVMLLILWTLPIPLESYVLDRLNKTLDIVEHLSSLEVFLAAALVAIHQVDKLVQRSHMGKYITIEIEAMQGLYIVIGFTVVVGIFRKIVRGALARRLYLDN